MHPFLQLTIFLLQESGKKGGMMADTVTNVWIYPPNWDGFLPDQGGFKRMALKMTCISDGTGETNVIKVNKSELRTHAGNVPSKIVIEKIVGFATGITVELKFDYATDQPITILDAGSTAGQQVCVLDYTPFGGFVPADDDGTGDIILTTTNAHSLDSYDISLEIRLKD